MNKLELYVNECKNNELTINEVSEDLIYPCLKEIIRKYSEENDKETEIDKLMDSFLKFIILHEYFHKSINELKIYREIYDILYNCYGKKSMFVYKENSSSNEDIIKYIKNNILKNKKYSQNFIFNCNIVCKCLLKYEVNEKLEKLKIKN